MRERQQKEQAMNLDPLRHQTLGLPDTVYRIPMDSEKQTSNVKERLCVSEKRTK